MGAARQLHSLTSTVGERLGGLNGGDFIHSRPAAPGQGKARQKRQQPDAAEMELGKLSAQFESGRDGIAAIGYDRNGGTSYGKYQVSSRAGSLNDFLAFLDGEAPDISKRLRAAGPGNTGSRKGAMPDMWRAIADEQPERFEALQDVYKRQQPGMVQVVYERLALQQIAKTGQIDDDNITPACRMFAGRESVWLLGMGVEGFCLHERSGRQARLALCPPSRRFRARVRS